MSTETFLSLGLAAIQSRMVGLDEYRLSLEQAVLCCAEPLMSKAKILYIEDNSENRLLVRRVLEAEGYCLTEAVDGLSGLQAAQADPPDLIIMDIMMPGLDGREATTRLRSIPQLQRVPIIALTASVLKGDRERALAAGCTGYLQKPLDIDRLPKQIQEFLDGQRESLDPSDELEYLREHNKRLAERLEQKVERLSNISEANRRLSNMSLTDELTALPNRRYLDRRIREEWALAKRFRSPLSCVMIDLDHFKRINDTFGHQAGDQLLQALAKVFSSCLREDDVVGRYGGEEFLVLLPQVETTNASTVAERIRKRVELAKLTVGSEAQAVHATISLGVATVSPDDEELTEQMLVQRADAALYRAKAEGRNRVVAG